MRAVDHRAVASAFGAVLRIARTDARLSQEDVAARADLDRTMPSLYERGLRQPTIGTLIALGRALGCDPSALLFVTEAIVCAEQSLFRAAIVLSWVGAMALLHDEVISKNLAAFNTEATKRDAKWKSAKSADDLGKMNEATFLEIAQAIGLVGKTVKQELDACLKLRNGCGHPNTLKVGPNKVAAHVETLALNVYAVFA